MTIHQLKTNANTGSITINSANQTNIIANQNQTSNQYTYNASSFSGTTKNQEDLNIAETISPLLSSKDITINSGLSGNTNNTNGINNINLLSSILVGQGNLTLNATNGNINMQSLQDQYYYYSKHELTNLDIGALIAEILAAIIIGALTGGAGAVGVIGAEVAATTAGMIALATTAAWSAGIASASIVIGMGVDSAIDHENGGAGATKDMQTGFSDSTTKQYGAKVGNSLLFGGNVNTNTGSISNNSVNIDSSTSISSSNLNQTAKNNESANYQHEHKNITTDVGKIMTDIAINVAVAVGAEVLGPLLESGVSKLGSFVSDSFGLSKAGGVDDLLGTGAKTEASGALVNANKVDMSSLTKEETKYVNNVNQSASNNLGYDITNTSQKQIVKIADNNYNIIDNGGNLSNQQIINQHAAYINYKPSPAYVKYTDDVANKTVNNVLSDNKLGNKLGNLLNEKPNEQLKNLQKLSDIQADVTGTPHAKLTFDYSGTLGKNYGQFQPGKIGEILINPNKLNKIEDVREMVDTVAHETQHTTQWNMINNISDYPKNIQNDIKIIRSNWANAQTYVDDGIMYYEQPLEKDAFNMGPKVANGIFGN